MRDGEDRIELLSQSELPLTFGLGARGRRRRASKSRGRAAGVERLPATDRRTRSITIQEGKGVIAHDAADGRAVMTVAARRRCSPFLPAVGGPAPASADQRQPPATRGAYRANNLGVARSSNSTSTAAAAAFREALEIEPASASRG